MHIVIVCNRFPYLGHSIGSAWVARMLCYGLKKAGHTATFLCRVSPPTNSLRRYSRDYDIKAVNAKSTEDLEKNPRVKRLIEQADIVHMHTALDNPFMLSLPYLVKKAGTSSVYTFHGVTPEEFMNYYAKKTFLQENPVNALEIISHYIAVSEYCREYYVDYAERNDLPKLEFLKIKGIKTILNGVDADQYKPVDDNTKIRLKEKLGLKDKTIVLFVGRMESVKGVEDIFKVAREFEDQRNVHFLLGGEARSSHPGEAKEILKRIDDIKNVEFTDKYVLDRRERHYIFNAADIFLFPSYIETLGLAAIEAMACKIPVVAARVGGLTEVVEHGENGFLVRRRDTDEMVKCLAELLNDEALRKKMGTAGHETFMKKFTLKKMVEEHVKFYKGILEEKH